MNNNNTVMRRSSWAGSAKTSSVSSRPQTREMLNSTLSFVLLAVLVWQPGLLAGYFVSHQAVDGPVSHEAVDGPVSHQEVDGPVSHQAVDGPHYFVDSRGKNITCNNHFIFILIPDNSSAENPVKHLKSAQFLADTLTLIIQYKDNQTIKAHLEDEDDCIYSGYMVGCTSSRVVVTGCVGMVQSVQIQSRMFGDMVFTTRDGVVVPVDPFSNVREKRSGDEIYYDYDDTIENTEFDRLFPDYGSKLLIDDLPAPPKPAPPKRLQLHVNVYLDKDWMVNFGKISALPLAKRILKHTSELWQHDSLSTKIDILTEPERFYTSSQHLLCTKTVYDSKLLDELNGPAAVKGEPTVHIYLTYSKDPLLVGLAQMNAMCSSSKGKPRIMVSLIKDEIRCAMTVAHEIGHLLGIEHDFVLGERNHACGKGKKTGESVMNYGDNRTQWTDCSNKDFKNYYNRFEEGFCLKEPSGKWLFYYH